MDRAWDSEVRGSQSRPFHGSLKTNEYALNSIQLLCLINNKCLVESTEWRIDRGKLTETILTAK
jgi:hypothetical protein